MNHTHHYSFWHSHEHMHIDKSKGIGGWEPETSEFYRYSHTDGHYHNWMQTHDHGGGADKAPHTHKAKQSHPTDDKVTKHHHALDAHDTEKEE